MGAGNPPAGAARSTLAAMRSRLRPPRLQARSLHRLLLPALVALLLPACGDGGSAAVADGAAAIADAPATDSAAPAAPAARSAAPAADLDRCHAAWDRVVSRHVVRGGIDYAAVAADRTDLDAFLACVRRIDPARLAEPDRVAYLSNVYNALVVDAVLRRYPDIPTVRDVDGFFGEETHTVGGRAMTLDDVETMAREIDPRVHFTVVCASTSCPDLLDEAYTGAAIERQLRRQTERFLADPTKGLRYDREANEVYLSSIFKWYAGDFTGGSTVVAFFVRGGVLDWVIEHLGDRRLAAELREREPSVKYLDYDWSLNDR